MSRGNFQDVYVKMLVKERRKLWRWADKYECTFQFELVVSSEKVGMWLWFCLHVYIRFNFKWYVFEPVMPTYCDGLYWHGHWYLWVIKLSYSWMTFPLHFRFVCVKVIFPTAVILFPQLCIVLIWHLFASPDSVCTQAIVSNGWDESAWN